MPHIQINNLLPIENLVPGFTARFSHTQNVTLAFWEIRAGALLPWHSHPHEQISIMITGKFELTIGDKTEIIAAGSLGVIPPHATHSGKAITDCQIADIFFPVREDYRF